VAEPSDTSPVCCQSIINRRKAMKTLFFTVALSSLALVACGQKATDPAATTATAPAADGMTADGKATMNGMTDKTGSSISAANDGLEYVTQAASGDQFEIQASQLALTTSKNAEVRKFAQQMIDDHRASTKKLQAAATGAALPAPGTEMLAAHQARLTELRESGAKFDELYLEQQRAAHAETIALHETMTAGSAAPASLASYAKEMLPTVQEHAKLLDTIKLGTESKN
jgi:putative membrane protein